MPTKRTPINRPARHQITPLVLDIYRKARKVYDECDSDYQTDALKACDGLCDKLYALFGRTKPYDVEIFATIDIDQPRDWENAKRWHEAKRLLAELEKAAEVS
jgi:hypothetical protein